MLVAAFATLGVPACGEGDEQKVRTIAERFARLDPTVCPDLAESAIKGAFDGSIAKCERELMAGQKRVSGRTIARVRIDSANRAVAIMATGDDRDRLLFRRHDDAWKLDRIVPAEDRVPPPVIRRGLDPRETLEAYLRAIGGEDRTAFCGLLSKRYATRFVGGGESEDPRLDCVAALEDFDWSDAQRKYQGVRPVWVRESDRKATVKLSSGTRALLVTEDDRWVIDDLRRPRTKTK